MRGLTLVIMLGGVALIGSGCTAVTELMGLDFESQLSDFTGQLEVFRETAKEVDEGKAE